MDRLDAMRVFVAVAEGQGFSAASRTLRMPLPTVCRKVSELEQQLGTELLVRTTRRVTVTESGHRYYEDVKQILEEVENAERQASGEYQQAKGLLTITAPAMFGRLHILPIVTDFMRLHEAVEIRLLFTNHVLDLPKEHINLGIRIGEISASSLDVIPAGSVRHIVCASPSYLSENGRPGCPKDIPQYECVTFSEMGNQATWRFRTPSGKTQEVVVRAKLSLNGAEAAVDAVMNGAGLTKLYSYQGANQVDAGNLEIIMDEHELDPSPVNIIVPRSHRTPQKVKSFIEYAMPALQERLLEVAKMCA